MKLIKEIINPRQRVLVLNGDFFQFSVIKHNLLPPSFLFANNTVAPQGEVLGLIRPFPEYSSSCSFNIVNSVGAIRYGALEMGVALGIRSIENSTLCQVEVLISPQIHPGRYLLIYIQEFILHWHRLLLIFSSGTISWSSFLRDLRSPMNWNSGWCEIMKITFLFRQSITAWYLLSQVMRRITRTLQCPVRTCQLPTFYHITSQCTLCKFC